MYVSGKKVARMFCVIPTAGCKLAFSVVSYNGQVNVSLAGYPGFLAIPDDNHPISGSGQQTDISNEEREFLRVYESEFQELLELARTSRQ